MQHSTATHALPHTHARMHTWARARRPRGPGVSAAGEQQQQQPAAVPCVLTHRARGAGQEAHGGVQQQVGLFALAVLLFSLGGGVSREEGKEPERPGRRRALLLSLRAWGEAHVGVRVDVGVPACHPAAFLHAGSGIGPKPCPAFKSHPNTGPAPSAVGLLVRHHCH